MSYVVARDGTRFVRSNVRCTCGRSISERLSPLHEADCRTRRRDRVRCERCAYLVWRLLTAHGSQRVEDPRDGTMRECTKRDVLVLQHISADTGQVMPGEVEVLLWAEGALRDGDRGGVALDPDHLTRAIAARDEGRARAAGRS